MPLPSPPQLRGALIVIEGLDRAGKSTQCALLQHRILNSRIIKFPDRTTPIGALLHTHLTTPPTKPIDIHTTHLLFSANRWEHLSSLLTSLSRGETLILDRYVYSGIAFSVASGLSYNYCRTPDVGLPLPDCIIFLDLPASTAGRRDGFGQERYETEEMQTRVRGVFGEVRRREAEGRWTVVDASESVEVVAGKVWEAVEAAVVAAAAGKELRRIE